MTRLISTLAAFDDDLARFDAGLVVAWVMAVCTFAIGGGAWLV